MCPEVRGKRTAPSAPSSEYHIRRQPPRVREPRSDVGSRRCVVVESGPEAISPNSKATADSSLENDAWVFVRRRNSRLRFSRALVVRIAFRTAAHRVTTASPSKDGPGATTPDKVTLCHTMAHNPLPSSPIINYEEHSQQGLGNALLEVEECGDSFHGKVRCRKRLGGLLRYYHRAAA